MNRNILTFILLLVLGQAASAQAEGPGRWRIAAQGGYAYRLGKVQQTGNNIIDSHNKRLKFGPAYGADITWYSSDAFGIGVKFSDMHASSKDAVTVTGEGLSESGMYTDVIDLRFIGPFMSSRHVNASGNGVFFLSYGLGYLGYVDNGRIIEAGVMQGGTLGALIEAGYDLRLFGNLFIGASLSAVGGTLSSYKMTMGGKTETVKLDKDEYEGLHHVALSLGLRYYL